MGVLGHPGTFHVILGYLWDIYRPASKMGHPAQARARKTQTHSIAKEPERQAHFLIHLITPELKICWGKIQEFFWWIKLNPARKLKAGRCSYCFLLRIITGMGCEGSRGGTLYPLSSGNVRRIE